jgi:hypothetical protein
LFDSWKHQFTDFLQNPETILGVTNIFEQFQSYEEKIIWAMVPCFERFSKFRSPTLLNFKAHSWAYFCLEYFFLLIPRFSLKNGLQSANYVGSLSITYNADVAIVGSCDTSPTKPPTGRARGQLIAFSQQVAK